MARSKQFTSALNEPQCKSSAIQVIDRMVSLLDVLSQSSEPVSLKTLSLSTGLHPSTAHRILNDLVGTRFVERIETGSYQLGMRLLELGNLVKARLNIRDAAMGPMRELHLKTGQPINLSIRQGDEIVYIERAVSERSGMQVVRAVGGRAPLHLTSVGKLFLALTRCGPSLWGRQRIRLLTSVVLNSSYHKSGPWALLVTTKNSSLACDALQQGFTTTPRDWSQACRFQRLQIRAKMLG